MTSVEVLSKTEAAATSVIHRDLDDCVYQSSRIRMRELVVYGGSSNPALVQEICKSLSIKEGAINLGKFSNGETSVAIDDSVREKDVYIVQSGCGHVNDNLTELLITVSACKMASAARVTAVLPLFPYSRQPDYPYNKKGAPLRNGAPRENYTFESVPGTPKREHSFESNISVPLNKSIAKSLFDNFETTGKKSKEEEIAWPASEIQSNAGYKEWVAQAGTLVADLLTCAGADHIITMDLHDPQFQGFFDVPVDNLYSKPLLQRYIVTQIKDFRQAVIVSPDAGGAKRATAIADTLGMDFALIHKERRPQRTSGRIVAPMMLVGAVSGRDAVLIDDLCDTSNTVTRAAKLLKDRGANYVYVLVTHGIFSGDALKRIKASAIDKIVTTNSVPQDEAKMELGHRLHVLDVGPIFGEAIRRIHNGESVSMLFDLGI